MTARQALETLVIGALFALPFVIEIVKELTK